MPGTAGTPRARALSAALRSAREASGIGLRELSRKLSISHALISHWENGRRVPTTESVAMVLATIGTPPDERERILDLARNADEPNWLTVGVPGVPQQLAGAVECERAASTITEWSPMLIPGLLQTTEYTRAIISANGLQRHEVETRLMIRASRREVISGRSPVTFNALIGEVSLREPMASPDIMRDQLHHLHDVCGYPNVSIRVVPLGVGWHPGCLGPYVLYEFPDAPPVLYFEHYSSGAFIPDPDDVKSYQEASQALRSTALDEKGSGDLIAALADEWSGKNDQAKLEEIQFYGAER